MVFLVTRKIKVKRGDTLSKLAIQYNTSVGMIVNLNKIRNRNLIYVGEVLNGLPDGKGTMNYKNDNVYRGLWKNGKKNGRGIYVKDNKIIQGVWTNDTLNKNVITLFSDSNDK